MKIRDRIVEFRRVPASELQPDPRNWRLHPKSQQDALRGVLAEIGYAGACLARRLPDGGIMLIDGHLRAETDPNGEIPTLILDVTEEEAAKILATFDPLSAMAEVDKSKLDALLREVDTGSPALQQMLEDLAESAGILGTPEIVEDEVPEPPVDPVTRNGDLWLMGEHRLLCGDSTKAEDVGRAMRGIQSGACITDPPYNVGLSYGAKVDDSKRKSVYEKFCRDWWGLVPFMCRIVTPGWINQAFWLSEFPPQSSAVWIKTNAMTRGTVTRFNCWEPVLFYGCRTHARPNDVFDFAVGMQKDVGDHPCPKPVKMWADLIEHYTNEGDVLYEPFGGAGTTIVAAEQLKRKALCVEIDPRYVDVACERYRKLTGIPAVLEGTGKHFDQVKEERLGKLTKIIDNDKRKTHKAKVAAAR